MQQILDYNTFDIRELAELDAKGKVTNAPAGYQRGRVHLVYNIKHDGRHKAQLGLDGHLTEVPLDSVYSSVVSLRDLRLVIFLSQLNNLELWGADIGNAYLESYTEEKI